MFIVLINNVDEELYVQYLYCLETHPSFEIKYSQNPFLILLATFSELLGTFCKLRKPCLSSVSDFQDPGMTVDCT